MKIAHNVHVLQDLFHPLYGMNAGFVLTRNHVVFVDAGLTTRAAGTILAYASAAGGSRVPEALLLTDHHPDHIFGMGVFRAAGCQVLGSVHLDGWIRDRFAGGWRAYADSGEALPVASRISQLMRDTTMREHLFGDIDVRPLDRTFSADEALMIDGEEIQVLMTPGHWTPGLSVYLPSSRTLFAGDAVFSGFRVYTGFGNRDLWQQWIESLNKLSHLDIAQIIPGHGPICDASEIRRNQEVLEELIEREGVGPA